MYFISQMEARCHPNAIRINYTNGDLKVHLKENFVRKTRLILKE